LQIGLFVNLQSEICNLQLIGADLLVQRGRLGGRLDVQLGSQDAAAGRVLNQGGSALPRERQYAHQAPMGRFPQRVQRDQAAGVALSHLIVLLALVESDQLIERLHDLLVQLKASGAANTNYNITYTDGTLTVTAKLAPQITWANPAAITYGTPLGDTQLKATADVPGSFSYTSAAGAMLNAGNGQTLHVAFTPTDTGTYASIEGSVSIDVLRAALTIMADNKTKSAGTDKPPLTATYAGFVNGDTVASLDTPAKLSTSATKSSPAGTYPITVSGASDANYTMTFVNGTLTVQNRVYLALVVRL
jgi:hypothetical protein